MEEREHRYRVAIYISPGYQDTHSIRTQLGRTVSWAGNKKAEYVVIGTGGRDVVFEWYKQARAALRPGSQIRFLDDIPSDEELGKRIDPQLYLYFSKDCEGVDEKSRLISKQGIDHRFTFMVRGEH